MRAIPTRARRCVRTVPSQARKRGRASTALARCTAHRPPQCRPPRPGGCSCAHKVDGDGEEGAERGKEEIEKQQVGGVRTHLHTQTPKQRSCWRQLSDSHHNWHSPTQTTRACEGGAIRSPAPGNACGPCPRERVPEVECLIQQWRVLCQRMGHSRAALIAQLVVPGSLHIEWMGAGAGTERGRRHTHTRAWRVRAAPPRQASHARCAVASAHSRLSVSSCDRRDSVWASAWPNSKRPRNELAFEAHCKGTEPTWGVGQTKQQGGGAQPAVSRVAKIRLCLRTRSR